PQHYALVASRSVVLTVEDDWGKPECPVRAKSGACSAVMPTPRILAGMRVSAGTVVSSHSTGPGGRMGARPGTAGSTLLWIMDWRKSTAGVVGSRLIRMRRRSAALMCPERSDGASILAAAAPSWTARLTPTPPRGLIA